MEGKLYTQEVQGENHSVFIPFSQNLEMGKFESRHFLFVNNLLKLLQEQHRLFNF